MLTIIIGLVISFILVLIAIKANFNYLSNVPSILGTAAVIIFVVSLVLGLFVPIEGYNEEAEMIEEIKLISLSNTVSSEGYGGMFYVSVSANNVYTYRYEVNNEYGISGKSYKVSTISKDVTEIESKDCKVPVLKIYRRDPKRFLFTFGLLADVTEYVFYVPEGTIQREVILK